MKHIEEFRRLRENTLRETEEILRNGNLIVHDAVSKIALLGSRGLKGGHRPDSDVDLGFILNTNYPPDEALCREILTLSLSGWKGGIELDAAVVFDKMDCGLLCYNDPGFRPGFCPHEKDCIGLYKIQKGFSGFVPAIGLEVGKILPVLLIWESD